MRALLVLALAALAAAPAAAQADNASTNGTGNETGGGFLGPGANGTNATGNGTNQTPPEEPVTRPGAFPTGLALLVLGAAVVVGLLVYAASRQG